MARITRWSDASSTIVRFTERAATTRIIHCIRIANARARSRTVKMKINATAAITRYIQANGGVRRRGVGSSHAVTATRPYIAKPVSLAIGWISRKSTISPSVSQIIIRLRAVGIRYFAGMARKPTATPTTTTSSSGKGTISR